MGTYKNPNYKKEYRQKHKDEINARVAKWITDNPDNRKEISRRYYEKNRDTIVNHRKSKQEQIQSSIEPFLKKILGRIRTKSKMCHAASKEKYKSCDITLEHLMELWDLQDGRCALTKKKMVHKFHSMFTVSVDRIDSSQGYVTGNVQLVCQSANYAKSNFTNEQFNYFWNHEEEPS